MITLIRHAQSTYNAHGDNSRDCPITEVGKKQASTLTGSYDLIICSTLKRARQTLETSNLSCDNVIFSDLCREIRDGNPINLLQDEDASKVDNETQAQINERVNEFRKYLKNMTSKYAKIGVISHGVFLGYLSGLPSCNCEQWIYKV